MPKISKYIIFLGLVIILGALSFGSSNPTLNPSSDTFIPIDPSGQTSISAVGGETDTPPDSMGCPPFRRTGEKKYTWSIETISGGPFTTSPSDGEESPLDTLTVDLDVAGEFNTSVTLREEWEDSSETPKKFWWPESE